MQAAVSLVLLSVGCVECSAHCDSNSHAHGDAFSDIIHNQTQNCTHYDAERHSQSYAEPGIFFGGAMQSL